MPSFVYAFLTFIYSLFRNLLASQKDKNSPGGPNFFLIIGTLPELSFEIDFVAVCGLRAQRSFGFEALLLPIIIIISHDCYKVNVGQLAQVVHNFAAAKRKPNFYEPKTFFGNEVERGTELPSPENGFSLIGTFIHL